MATLSNCNIKVKPLFLSFPFMALYQIKYSILIFKRVVKIAISDLKIKVYNIQFLFPRVSTRSGKVRKIYKE